jgi:hypothetical protein
MRISPKQPGAHTSAELRIPMCSEHTWALIFRSRMALQGSQTSQVPTSTKLHSLSFKSPASGVRLARNTSLQKVTQSGRFGSGHSEMTQQIQSHSTPTSGSTALRLAPTTRSQIPSLSNFREQPSLRLTLPSRSLYFAFIEVE